MNCPGAGYDLMRFGRMLKPDAFGVACADEKESRKYRDKKLPN
jgi:hypothetical protein